MIRTFMSVSESSNMTIILPVSCSRQLSSSLILLGCIVPAPSTIRAINTLYPDQPKKIAKTSGESINQRGIAKAMGRLREQLLL